MQTLADTIARELKRGDHFAVYQPELARVWPQRESREKEIIQFAQRHGWRLRFYKDDLVAIFDKDPATQRDGF